MKTVLYSCPQSILKQILAERDEGPIARLVAFKVPHCILPKEGACHMDEKCVAAVKNVVLKVYLSLVVTVLRQIVSSDDDYVAITLEIEEEVQKEIDNVLWDVVSSMRGKSDNLDIGLGTSFRTVFFYLLISMIRRHAVQSLKSRMTGLLQSSSKTKSIGKKKSKSGGIWGRSELPENGKCAGESYKVDVEAFYRHLADDVSHVECCNYVINNLKEKISKFNTVCAHLKELEQQEKIGGCLYGK